MSKTIRTKNWVSIEEDNRIWVSTTSYLYCPIFQNFIVIQRYGSWLILRVKSNLPKLIPSQSSQIFDIGIQDLKTAFTEIFKQHKERGKRLKWEVCLHTKLFQKCSTLCDPMDCNRPGSSVHGILQARILEWVPMPSSRGSSWSRSRTHVSCLCKLQAYFLLLSYRESPKQRNRNNEKWNSRLFQQRLEMIEGISILR